MVAYSAEIVRQSDKAGIDDRFIMALTGVETTYGKFTVKAIVGDFNAFSNGRHCAALDPRMPFCVQVAPYASYIAAIDDAVSTLNNRIYRGLSSGVDIYNQYERGSVSKTSPQIDLLTKIYEDEFKGDKANVRFSRCTPDK